MKSYTTLILLLATFWRLTSADINVYSCNEANEELSEVSIEKGQTIRLCISSSETPLVGIETFTFLQESTGRHSTVKAQNAILHNKVESRRSSVSCPKKNLCVVETMLLDKFFASTTFTSLSISGVAKVEDPSSNMRGGQPLSVDFKTTQKLSHDASQTS